MGKFSFQIMLTRRCPLECPYCYVRKNGRDMSRDIARRAVDFIFDKVGVNDRLFFNITGGEPFLLQDTLQYVVRYVLMKSTSARLGDLLLYVNTSGYLTPRRSLLMSLADGNVAGYSFRVDVSIDGPPEFHDKCRRTRGRGTYDRVIKNALYIKKYVPVLVRSVLYPEALQNEDLVIEWFYEMLSKGFWMFEMGLEMGLYFEYPQEFYALYDKLMSDVIDSIAEEMANGRFVLLHPVASNLLLYASSGKPVAAGDPLPCGAGKTRFTVDVDGRVYPCTLFLEMAPEDGLLGDLITGVSERAYTYPCPLSEYDVGPVGEKYAEMLRKALERRGVLEEYLAAARQWV